MSVPLQLPAWTATHLARLNTVVCADLFELCATIPPGSVDMILCDLPYGSLEVGWDKVIPAPKMWMAFMRIIKPQGVIALTTKQPFSSLVVNSNLKLYRYSWYWEKSRGANVAQTGFRPLAVIEEILVFSLAPAVFSNVPTMNYYPQKEKLLKPYIREHKPNHQSIVGDRLGSPMRNPERGIGTHIHEYSTPRSLLRFNDENERGYHPTQKPIPLFEYLIRTYTQPGDLVFDPCVGSGTTALAARNTGRRFICGDKEQQYVDIAKDRLRMPFEKRHIDMTGEPLEDLPLFSQPQAGDSTQPSVPLGEGVQHG